MTKKGRANFTQSLPEVVEFFSNPEYNDGVGTGNFILDCELMSKDFLTLQTKVRTTKTVITDPLFYIKAFDILMWDDFDYIKEQATHDDRYYQLNDFVGGFGEQKFLRMIVQAPQPLTEEYLQQCLDKVVSRGGEGLVIKNPEGVYMPGKRSHKGWVKVLPEREMDVIFTAAIGGEGKYVNTLGALEAFGCAENGDILETIKFNVGTGWDDALRNDIWQKSQEPGFFPINGKIKMKDVYPTGIPRMPVFKSFNVDKEA
jgi:ATP-dependent DNA ligase